MGIDAILNYKGYAGDKGLESYKGFGQKVQPSARRSKRPAGGAGARPQGRRRHPREGARSSPSGTCTRRTRPRSPSRRRRVAGQRDSPLRGAASGSQARARARLRRWLRAGNEARRRGVLFGRETLRRRREGEAARLGSERRARATSEQRSTVTHASTPSRPIRWAAFARKRRQPQWSRSSILLARQRETAR